MKKIFKSFLCMPMLFVLLSPAFTQTVVVPIKPPVEIDPGDVASYSCANPIGSSGEIRASGEYCPSDALGSITYVCSNPDLGIGSTGKWLKAAICTCNDSTKAYDSSTNTCKFKCPDGALVDNKNDCCVAPKEWIDGLGCMGVSAIKSDCTSGQKGYQTCEKNGVDCGTQERTCSALGKWSSWGECKVL